MELMDPFYYEIEVDQSVIIVLQITSIKLLNSEKITLASTSKRALVSNNNRMNQLFILAWLKVLSVTNIIDNYRPPVNLFYSTIIII